MEFLTQTIFAFAVIGYIYSIKDHKKKSTQSHRIAMIMSRFFPQSYSIDIEDAS